MLEILAHTPPWVWLLLAFVLSRGVAALRPREIPAQRALILPLAFLVWGVAGIMSSRGLGLDLVYFLVGGAIGAWAGAGVAWRSAPPVLELERGLLLMPGSLWPLVMIGFAFPIKYALAVALATADAPSQAAVYASLSAVAGGAFAGLFWGRALVQFRRALSGAGCASDWRAVARLAGSGKVASKESPT